MKFLLAFGLMIAPAYAHDAKSGWSYPFACCSNQDCREVNVPETEVMVSEVQGGFSVNTSGEFIPWDDSRVRPSPDGKYHLCTLNGENGGRTICLFRPDKGY